VLATHPRIRANYFVLKKNHAHAMKKKMFPHADLRKTSLRIPAHSIKQL
jgi:hypothetical protein